MYSTTGILIPMAVSEGDKILFNTYSSNQEHKLDGELVYIMSQNEVLSIVED
jgi:co-chaperonin GroES (HSP10)